MKINRAKFEVRVAHMKVEESPDEYGVESLNPRGQIAKQMEMAARRSIHLHLALLEMLDIQGTISEVKYNPMVGDPTVDRHLKAALSDTFWRTPTWKYGWEYMVNLWASGGLKRGVDVAMMNMPTVNRKRVEKEMKKAEMKDRKDMEDYIQRTSLGYPVKSA